MMTRTCHMKIVCISIMLTLVPLFCMGMERPAVSVLEEFEITTQNNPLDTLKESSIRIQDRWLDLTEQTLFEALRTTITFFAQRLKKIADIEHDLTAVPNKAVCEQCISTCVKEMLLIKLFTQEVCAHKAVVKIIKDKDRFKKALLHLLTLFESAHRFQIRFFKAFVTTFKGTFACCPLIGIAEQECWQELLDLHFGKRIMSDEEYVRYLKNREEFNVIPEEELKQSVEEDVTNTPPEKIALMRPLTSKMSIAAFFQRMRELEDDFEA